MSASPAAVVREFLIANNVFGDPDASSLSWPLYLSFMPDDFGVSEAVAIYDSPGWKDGRYMSGENIIHFGVQVRVRARSFDEAWAKAMEGCLALEAVNGDTVVVDSTSYVLLNVSQQGSPMFLGIEPGTLRRSHVSVNFNVTMR